MNQLMRTVAVIWIAISGSFALSQTNACANPNAPRIGLLILDNQATPDPAASSQSLDLSKRLVAADTTIPDQLLQRLPADVCIVTKRDIFNDPKNFPQLKGSTIIEISADASLKNPSVFALAVTVSSAEGIYAHDQFRMFTRPVLIEADSDYALGAEGILKFWQFWGEAVSRRQNK